MENKEGERSGEGKTAMITVSVVKSFAYRVSKPLVLQNVRLDNTVGEVRALIVKSTTTTSLLGYTHSWQYKKNKN